ncbi:MAG: NlpC/P60 family protein, partial [Clostridiales bacterium]|nr:NlpC/P60 family protein [Clostridiales bacterium]
PIIEIEPDTDFPAVEEEEEPLPELPPPLWALSNQKFIPANLGLAEQIRLLQAELNEKIDQAGRTYSYLTQDVRLVCDESNLLDVFAVYALRHNMMENFPYEIRIETREEQDELREIFWRLTGVTAKLAANDGELYCEVRVSRGDYTQEMSRVEQHPVIRRFLTGIMTDETRELANSQLDNSILSILTDEEFAEVRAAIPDDVTGERRLVLLAALSLKGKVNYFWGGKSRFVGWDERWGMDAWETGKGAKVSAGSIRPFGLDCSGFVTWAFVNAGGDDGIIAYIGNGTSNQWRNSREIAWKELQPGDLLFYKNPGLSGTNHVGIVLGWDEDGQLLVVHSSSSRNGVVVTGAKGFKHARRPYIYANDAM